MDSKERKIKSVLQRQSGQLNHDALWDAIGDKLPSEKKRRIAFYWYFLLLLPLGFLGFYVNGLSLEIQPKIEEEKYEVRTPEEVLLVQKGEDGGELYESSISTKELEQKENSEQSTAENIKSSELNGHNILAEKNDIVIENIDHSQELDYTPHRSRTKIEDKYASESSLSEVTADQKSNIGQNRKSKTENTSVLRNTFSASFLFSDIKHLEKERNFSRRLKLRLVNVGSREKSNFSLILMSGFNQSLVSWNGGDFAINEKGVLGFSTSLYLDYRLRKRWSLRAGLGYDYSTVRYDDNSISFSKGVTDGLAEINVNAAGQISEVQGELETIVKTSNNIVWHRSHQLYNAELYLMRNFSFAGRWRAGIQAGINYNVWAESGGYHFDFSENITHVKNEKDETTFYEKTWGLRPGAGLELGYTYRNLEFIMNVDYVQAINPINTQTQIYQIKHSQAGLRIGTRYYLQGNKN